MKRATEHFSDEERRNIARAVVRAEAGTAAEIVPVVATGSGRYDRAEDLFGLAASIVALTVTWVLFQREDPTAGGWDGLRLALPLWVLVVIVVAGFLLGVLIAVRVAWIRRLLVPRRERETEVNAAAARLFFDRRIHHTAASTGMLIYVSLFERRAVILGDEAVVNALGRETLDALCRDLVRDLRAKGVPAALAAAIERAGEHLREKLPGGEAPDEDELPDALVTIG